MTTGWRCRIWDIPTTPHTERPDYSAVIRHSDRAGGGYEIAYNARSPARNLEDTAKARLTTWLIDQRNQGSEFPRVTRELVERVGGFRALDVEERAIRLLRFLAGKSPRINQAVRLPNDPMYVDNLEAMESQSPELGVLWEALAWSESTKLGEVDFLINYLEKQSWIDRARLHDFDQVVVTVDGYARIQEAQTNVDARQAFVAMWFAEEMKDAYSEGIEPAIEDAGYSPMRVDQEEYIDKVDDKILAEIRRSRFLVADFSQGGDGARGGVYFEAGFALGLGIPVIFACRKSDIEDVHFDTRQYNHILWETPEQLREALKNRILAVIGEGPVVSGS